MAELTSDGAQPPAVKKQGNTDSDRLSPNSPILTDETDPLTKSELFQKLDKSAVSPQTLGLLEWTIFEKLLEKGKVTVRFKHEDTETEEPETTTTQTTTGIVIPTVTRDSPQPSTSTSSSTDSGTGSGGPTPSQMLFGIDTIFQKVFERSIDPQTNNIILSGDQKEKLEAIKTEDYRCKTLQMDVIKQFSPSSFTKDVNLFRKSQKPMRKPDREHDGMAWMETYTEIVKILNDLDKICYEYWMMRNDKATFQCLTGVQTFIGEYQALVYNLIQKKEPEERHFQILFMHFLEAVVQLFPQAPYDSYHKKFIVPTMNLCTTGYTFAVPHLVLYERSLVPDSTGSMAYIEVKKKDKIFSDIAVRQSEMIDNATPRKKLMCHLRDTVGAVLAKHYLELLGGAEDTVFKTLEIEENVPVSYYTKLGIMQWNTKIKFVILKMPEKRFRTLVKQTQEYVNKYRDEPKKKEQKEREATLEAIAREDEDDEDQKKREKSGGSTHEEYHEKRGKTRQSLKRTAKQDSKNEEGSKKKKISEGETSQEFVEVKSKSCLKKRGNKKSGMSQGEVTFEDDKSHKSKYNYPELWISKSYSFLKHSERLDMVHSLLKFAHIAQVLRPNVKRLDHKEDF